MKLFIFFNVVLATGQVPNYTFWIVDPDNKTFKPIGESGDRDIVEKLAIEWGLDLVDLPGISEFHAALILENVGYKKT